jgi:hypothetical protein
MLFSEGAGIKKPHQDQAGLYLMGRFVLFYQYVFGGDHFFGFFLFGKG